MILSLGSLLSLMIVFLGGLNKDNITLRNLYYFKADTSGFKHNFTSATGSAALNSEITSLFGNANAISNLSDFYEVYMWNYCSGSKSADGTETVTYCSPRQAKFVFDPIKTWGLSGTPAQNLIPSAVTDALNAYEKGAQWLFISYAVAFFVTLGSIVVGLFAICSRLGSCVTSIVAIAATIFTGISAILSTVLYSTVVGAMDGYLKPYDIKFSLGTKMIALDWVAVAFSLGASLFWVISICCCSGKSSRRDRGSKQQSPAAGYGGYAPFGPNRGYAPLADESGRQHQHPTKPHEMQDFGYTGAGGYTAPPAGGAYEPYRHQR